MPSHRNRRRSHGLRALRSLLLAAVLGCASAAGAVEIVVQNDSVPGGGAGTPLATFIAGERVAVWLTAPVSGDIVAVQVDWRSLFGGAPTVTEHSVTVHAGGVFPTPGPALATVLVPPMVDGLVNEFRFLDPPADTVPLQVPVTSGQTFVVALEFFNTNAGGGGFLPSVVIDGDGCQPGLNTVFPIPPSAWTDACPLGVTGDFVIRAVIDQPVSTPALTSTGALWLAGLLSLAAALATLRRRLAPVRRLARRG